MTVQSGDSGNVTVEEVVKTQTKSVYLSVCGGFLGLIVTNNVASC